MILYLVYELQFIQLNIESEVNKNMPDSFNLSSGSDMDNFQKSLENAIKKQSVEAIKKKQFDVKCPHCQTEIRIYAGKSACPYCGKEVNLTLDIKF